MSNVFSFTGTVGRDCEVRFIPSGQAVLSVTVANNIGFGDKKQTLWVRVTLWGKRAEGELQNYLKKGQVIFVSGELSQREYEKDGVTKTSLELNASIIDLVGGQRDNSQQAAPARQAQPKPTANRAPTVDDFDDDIPF